ncbi:ABC transporter permease [Halopseudomonas pachastrellae]|nr:ABC transporter permease [Halopseudomonas pachastrellae]
MRSFDVSHLPLAVVDEDRSALSRSLIQKFAVSETFDLKFQETRVATATDLLEKGDATMVLVVPAGFEGALLAGKSAQLQLLQDGTPIPTLPPMPSMMLCRSSSARSAKRSCCREEGGRGTPDPYLV